MARRRVPYVEQMHQSECGLCCLAMISAYHKKEVSLSRLRERADVGRDGTTLLQLKKIAVSIGFDVKAYRIEHMDQFHLKQVSLPAILHWNQGHFVVLEKIDNNYARIVDPRFGRIKLSLKNFSEQFSGFLMTVGLTERIDIEKSPNIWLDVLVHVKAHKNLFVYVFLITLALQFIVIGMPLFMKHVIDEVMIPKNSSLSITIFISVVGFLLAYMIITFVRSRVLVRLHNALDYEMQTRFFSHLLKLPFPFFLLRSYGDMLFRMNSLVTIRNQLSGALITGILDSFMLFVLSGYMLFISPLLAMIVFLLVSINILLVIFTKQYVAEINQQQVVATTEVQAVQTEMLYGIMGVKISGTEQQVYSQWLNKFKHLLQVYRRKENLNSYITTTSNGLQFMSPLIVLSIGVMLITGEYSSMTVGMVVSFQAIATLLFTTSSSLMNTINSYILTTTILKRIHDVLEAPPEQNEGKLQLKVLGDIRLSHVSYSYSKYSPIVINDISLHIKLGQKIAIIGQSGSGKSTLAHLIIGLFAPLSGEVYYDGYGTSDLDMQYVRKQMGIVPQDISLFNRSVFDNIAMHQDGVTMDEVVRAAKAANIHDEIMSMPMQYQTVLAEMGRNISGGQRQRIALAKAILNNPSVLVLDEATSALDHITEARVDAYLSSIKCTRIVIAHRLSTVMNSDMIIVLENGRVCDVGNHNQLLHTSDYYQYYYKEMSS
ncbi:MULTISPECIES: peptidase domain-containing ABC transporter [unclassified Paenibacillus]|uniref:peptidase domain-containing ABC transporter n=1 Tax=unclassified Paenibacillus TaxID=185978 RepID=UPI0008BE7E04|nr:MULTISPECIES: peptidase domain-containing ABC transporter [unclassified Paenibacillus]QLG37818.1 peptidase domain-containing ABC transporter [Paenibacillus sp. E222]SEO51225.1 ABC-type bacteriocin/lantibiotic exporter, contains an N-terminal double-glycine peptidase domain [Paenibacillus sp. OK076]